jgi:hypothetical protein
VKNQNQGKSRFKSGRLADHYYNNRRKDNKEPFPVNHAQRKKSKKMQNIFQPESVLDSENDLETLIRPNYLQYAKPELSQSEPEPVFPNSRDKSKLKHFQTLPEPILPFNERYTLDWISKPNAVYKDDLTEKTWLHKRTNLNQFSNPKNGNQKLDAFDFNYRTTWKPSLESSDAFQTLKHDQNGEHSPTVKTSNHQNQDQLIYQRVNYPKVLEQNPEDGIKSNQFQTHFQTRPYSNFRFRAQNKRMINYQAHNNFDNPDQENPIELANRNKPESENKLQDIFLMSKQQKQKQEKILNSPQKNQHAIQSEGSVYLPSRDVLNPELSRLQELYLEDNNENQIQAFELTNSPLMTSQQLLTSGLKRLSEKENFRPPASKVSVP